jgi:hypothetical protein
MADFRHVSDSDLQEELLRRKEARSKAPDPVANPDFSRLIEHVTSGVAECIKDQYEDDDFKHYIYEAAMEAIYGKVYWTWRNQQDW